MVPERTRVAASCGHQGKPIWRRSSAPSSPDEPKVSLPAQRSQIFSRTDGKASQNFADGDSIISNTFFPTILFNKQTCCHSSIFVSSKTSSQVAPATDVNYLQLLSMLLVVWEPHRTSVCISFRPGMCQDVNEHPVKLTFSFLLSYPLAALLKRVPDEKPALKNLFIIA